MVQDWQNRAFGLLTCDEQIDGLDVVMVALRPGRGVSPKTDGFGHGRREQENDGWKPAFNGRNEGDFWTVAFADKHLASACPETRVRGLDREQRSRTDARDVPPQASGQHDLKTRFARIYPTKTVRRRSLLVTVPVLVTEAGAMRSRA
jgi:hypothetical protein